MNFAEKVYSLVKKVPKGKITTYKEIAEALNTKAYRAVGTVLAKNPGSFMEGGNIPCHRVVCSDGKIGGFCGKKEGRAVKLKKKLLESEGLKIKNNKIINFKEFFFKL